ncbi:hypothetical protein ACJMK2_033539 [Sinanodonta woodiana]|uniref:Aquaporin n=1 Tax=Sinanodonta woodiana TaxID=1069815 RepID=A0ABD3WNP3_SINWO
MSYSETENGINVKDSSTGYYETIVRPILAEFVGVCLLVFVGSLSLQDNLQATVALTHGLTVTLLIIGLGGISGGHFNPAVSLGVIVAGAIDTELAIGYIIGQLLGGVFGATLVRAMLPSHVYKNIKGGNHRLGFDVESNQAILGEIILTTALVFIVLMSTINRRTKSKLAPLAIGFAVTVDILSGGRTTGASMNPARALGPAIVSYGIMTDSFDDLFVWWVGPLLGGLLAGLLYSGSELRWVDQSSPQFKPQASKQTL